MSNVRVRAASATVEMEADDFYVSGGPSQARYIPADVVRATVQALRATDFGNWADAIENGLDREGLVL